MFTRNKVLDSEIKSWTQKGGLKAFHNQKAGSSGKETCSQSRTLLLKNQEADHEEKRRVQNFISENAFQSFRSQAKNAHIQSRTLFLKNMRENTWPNHPVPAHSRSWKKKRIMRFWNGPSGWSSERKNSRPIWPQIDRKRTREQLKTLVVLLNPLRRPDPYA